MDVAHHQRDGAFRGLLHRALAFAVGRVSRSVGVAFKAVDAELSPARGEVRLGHFFHGQADHILIISCGNDGRCLAVTEE